MPKTTLLLVLLISLLSLTSRPTSGQIETLGVGAVKPTPAIAQKSDTTGKRNSLDRVVQSLDGQLIDRINATRKFQVVGRSDLKELLKEQEFAASGNVDANDKNAAQQFKMAGARYVLITAVDDFQDYNETATFTDTGRSASKRVIRLSAVGKIYDSTKGQLLESANFQMSNKDITSNHSYSVKDGDLSDELMVEMARGMAEKIANRVTDVIFPAKVVAVQGRQIIINRGDGTGIAVGQMWNAFAVGEELIDPDTKQSLGRQETPVGKVKITSVLPKVANAESVEDTGITVGSILRHQ